MKIGIVTFFAAHSYGAVLQSFALQTVLKRMGHDPYFVNYVYHFEGRSRHSPDIGRAGKYLFHPKLAIRTVFNQFVKLPIVTAPFAAFREHRLNVGARKYLDFSDLLANPPAADMFICGSDQVWNPQFLHSQSDEGVSWLAFAGETIPRIAYAASICCYDIDEDIKQRYASHAARFQAVSVREEEACDFLRSLGIHDPIWVPDPTLLLDASEYRPLMPARGQERDRYVFSFSLGGGVESMGRSLAHTLGCSVLAGSTLSMRWYVLGGFQGPGGWLEALNKACFVVTDSYHGMVFSILLHRPFIVLLKKKADEAAKNCRITSLLRILGLSSRAVLDDDPAETRRISSEQIDWPRVDTAVWRFRDKGLAFLHDALAGDRHAVPHPDEG